MSNSRKNIRRNKFIYQKDDIFIGNHALQLIILNPRRGFGLFLIFFCIFKSNKQSDLLDLFLIKYKFIFINYIDIFFLNHYYFFSFCIS